MSDEPTIWIRGVNLVHDGRGYHDLELPLPVSLARTYIARGLAVEIPTPAPQPAPSPEPIRLGKAFDGTSRRSSAKHLSDDEPTDGLQHAD